MLSLGVISSFGLLFSSGFGGLGAIPQAQLPHGRPLSEWWSQPQPQQGGPLPRPEKPQQQQHRWPNPSLLPPADTVLCPGAAPEWRSGPGFNQHPGAHRGSTRYSHSGEQGLSLSVMAASVHCTVLYCTVATPTPVSSTPLLKVRGFL